MMKRAEFVKIAGLGAPGLILPGNAGNMLREKSIKIYDNYVQGMMKPMVKIMTSAQKTHAPLDNMNTPHEKMDAPHRENGCAA